MAMTVEKFKNRIAAWFGSAYARPSVIAILKLSTNSVVFELLRKIIEEFHGFRFFRSFRDLRLLLAVQTNHGFFAGQEQRRLLRTILARFLQTESLHPVEIFIKTESTLASVSRSGRYLCSSLGSEPKRCVSSQIAESQVVQLPIGYLCSEESNFPPSSFGNREKIGKTGVPEAVGLR